MRPQTDAGPLSSAMWQPLWQTLGLPESVALTDAAAACTRVHRLMGDGVLLRELAIERSGPRVNIERTARVLAILREYGPTSARQLVARTTYSKSSVNVCLHQLADLGQVQVARRDGNRCFWALVPHEDVQEGVRDGV